MTVRFIVRNEPPSDLRDTGSPYDPVVRGVAQGLNALFPPIHHQVWAKEDQPFLVDEDDGGERASV